MSLRDEVQKSIAGGVVMYRPHPFSWIPACGKRHASADTKPLGGYPNGFVVATLCRHQLPADNSDVAWLWETCPECNVKAHELAGIPMPKGGTR